MKILKIRKFISSSNNLITLKLDYAANPELIGDLSKIQLDFLSGKTVKINLIILQQDLHKLNTESIEEELSKHCLRILPIVPKIIKEKITKKLIINPKMSLNDKIKSFIDESNMDDNKKNIIYKYASDLVSKIA